jgi:hypothetical protein
VISIKQEDSIMKKFFAFAIALTAFFAVSCQKEKELHPVGSQIVFTAATEYTNGVETRTIYSGDYTNTTPKYERIQWISTDDVEILYSHGSNSSAQYDIDGSTILGSGNQRKSTADITLKSGSSALTWADGGTHKFFGVYPAPNNSNGLTLTTTGSGNNLNGRVTGLVIPDHQTATWDATKGKYLPDMSKAYMVSFADYSQNPATTVALPFTPVMSAFEFNLKLPDNRPSYTVSKVQLSTASTDIAGGYSVDITGYDTTNEAVTWTYAAQSSPTASTSVVVSFNNNGATEPAIPNSNAADGLHFTLFTLPVSISNPVLSIKYHDGTVKQVTLTGLTLGAGQKVVVSNNKAGHDDFTYEISSPSSQQWEGHVAHTFSNIPVTTSIKRSKANNSHTENVTWKVQCKSPIWNTWSDGLPPEQVYSNFTLTEDHNNNTFSVGFPAAGIFTDNTITAFDAATEILQKREPLSSARDLSMYDVAGNSLGSRTAANCYVVSRPGTYRIPFYYGNAVVGGQTNLSAYYPDNVSAISSDWRSGNTDETQNYYLPRFYNAVGEYITNPNIITDITNSSYGGVGTLTAGVTWFDSFTVTPTVSGNGANDYIQFTITPENIKPGNILIQLASSTVGGTWPVIWSWHIWVTDRDLTPQNGVMPVNLGWVDADVVVPGAVTRYQDQTLTLRLVQVENGVEVNWGTEFTLSTKGGEVVSVENNSQGKNPHFQWGRKDPFNEDASTILLMKHADNGASGVHYWRGIRTNNVMLEGEKSLTWMDGPAVPLYNRTGGTVVPNRYVWTIKIGHEKYGPFTTANKDALAQTSFTPSGATWVETMASEIQSYTVKSTSNSELLSASTVAAMIFTYGWFTSDYFHPTGGVSDPFYFEPGKVFSIEQRTYFYNIVSPGGNSSNIWYNTFGQDDWESIRDILNNQLEPNYGTGQWDLTLNGASFPYGPHSQEVADVLILHSGVYQNADFDYVQETTPVSYSYTTDAARNAGSILYNLWNSALYNENASVTKYKSVYDPCPAGFAVPTIETYLGSSWASQVGNNKEATGLAAMPTYPQTSARINDLNCAVSGTANSPLYTGSPAKGFYWTDRPCNMEVVNAANKHTIDGYQYHTDSYILMTETSTSTVAHYNRRAAASIRPMRDPGSNIYPAATASPGNASGGLEGVSTGTELY